MVVGEGREDSHSKKTGVLVIGILTRSPRVGFCDESWPCISSTSDVITFDQNWHHLFSTSAVQVQVHFIHTYSVIIQQ